MICSARKSNGRRRHPLKTLKQQDYLDWKKLIDIKKEGLHKTERSFFKSLILKKRGREMMEKSKSMMNRYRKSKLYYNTGAP